MGDSNTGGGGSVQWSVRMKREKRSGRTIDSGYTKVDGADTGQIEDQDDFTISVALDGETIDQFRAAWDRQGNRAERKLKIRTDSGQIKIQWPDY
jgi:hypothetical protein